MGSRMSVNASCYSGLIEKLTELGSNAVIAHLFGVPFDLYIKQIHVIYVPATSGLLCVRDYPRVIAFLLHK